MRSGLKVFIVYCSIAIMMLVTANACRKAPARQKIQSLNLKTTRLAVIPGDYEVGEITFSPDGRRAAYEAKKDGKSFIVLDDKAGNPYDGVADLVFSPDSRRTAYRASNKKGDQRVVLDGRESEWYGNLGNPAFSPDGRIIGYEAKIGEEYVMVAGDKKSPAFSMPYAPPLFNSGSTRIAYIEQHYDTGKKNVIVSSIDMTDRKRGEDYDSLTDMILSADRSLLVYKARKNKKKLVVTSDFSGKGFKEKEGAIYDETSNFVLSPDGKQVAYFAKRDGRFFLVVNGAEEPYEAPDMPFGLVLSKDGRRSAGVAMSGGQVSLLVDGKAGRSYDEIGRSVFSPDGSQIAFPVRKGETWVIVVNGNEGPAFDMIVTPIFSPDGSRIIYRTRKDGKRFVVTADKEGRTIQEHKRYEMVWQPVFTPDGKSIAYGVKTGRELWWIVEPIR